MKKLLVSLFAINILSIMPVFAQECTAVRASHILVKTESDAKLMRSYVEKGLPFEVRLPYEKPVCMGALSEEELNAELEKGYADILAGRTKPAKQAFAEMRNDFNI